VKQVEPTRLAIARHRTIRFTLLIEQSQDFWFCLYIAKLVQFLKLVIFACESLPQFLLLPIKVNKVLKNLFGSVLPDFLVVTVVSIIAVRHRVSSNNGNSGKKYVIESQEFCISSRFLPVSTLF
jgi:hypothetical protein